MTAIASACAGHIWIYQKITVIQRDNQQDHILLFFDFQDIYHDNAAEREQNSKRKNSTNIRPAKRGMEKEIEKKTTSEKQDKQPEKSQLRQKKIFAVPLCGFHPYYFPLQKK